MADAPVVAPVAPVAPIASEGAKTTEVAKPTPAAERTLRLVIDGQEKVLTETQAIMQLQKLGAVDKRMEEVSKERKKLDSLLKAFEEDPEAALAKLGKDPKKLIEDYLAKKAKADLLTPEQQEKQKLQEELEKYKKQTEEAEKEKLSAKQKEMDAHNERALEDQLVEAAKRHQLDANWETLEMMTDVALEAIELGIENITPDQIAQEVLRRQKEQLDTREKKILSNMTPQQLIDYVGPKRFKEMLKESLKKIPSASVPKPKVEVTTPKPTNGKTYTPQEWVRLNKQGKI